MKKNQYRYVKYSIYKKEYNKQLYVNTFANLDKMKFHKQNLQKVKQLEIEF